MENLIGILFLIAMIGALVYIFKRNANLAKSRKIGKENRLAQVPTLQLQLEAMPEMPMFYPDRSFYAPFKKDRLAGLHHMADALFTHLGIAAEGCTIDFISDNDLVPLNSADASGLFRKFTAEDGRSVEQIFINKRYTVDPHDVGANLAHEIMHLYLFRKQIVNPDVPSNELMTDLSTIRAGLSIVTMNGYSSSNSFWLSLLVLILFRFTIWTRSTLSFGYFLPKEYGALARADLEHRGVFADAKRYLTSKAHGQIGW
ncbi:MAG: hypothetical protein JWO84_252 [Parcubacteria group bacterium]|nr:hypothetical protein [Parcubacteria group bacterium]